MSVPVEVDYYEILEICQAANTDDVRSAYRRLCLIRHPDKNPGKPDAHAAFCTLAEAYEILKDTNRRIIYDAKYSSIKSKWRTFRESEKQRCRDEESARTKAEAAKRQAERLRREEVERETARQNRIKESQRESIVYAQIQEELTKVTNDIRNIESKAKERLKSGQAAKGWWGYLTTGWGKKPESWEEQKRERDLENLQKQASDRIKIARLNSEKQKLIEKQAIQVKKMEEAGARDRIRVEKEARDEMIRQAAAKRAEALEREAQEREAQKKWAKWLEEREAENLIKRRAAEKLAQEKAERIAQERAERIAKETADRLAKEIAQETARQKAKERELAAKAAQEKLSRAQERELKDRIAKAREAQRREQQAGHYQYYDDDTGPKTTTTSAAAGGYSHNNYTAATEHNGARRSFPPNKTPRRSTTTRHANSTSGSGTNVKKEKEEGSNPNCAHAKFWPKIQGPHRCSLCAQTFHSFILQCPDCRRLACASCKRQIKLKENWENGL